MDIDEPTTYKILLYGIICCLWCTVMVVVAEVEKLIQFVITVKIVFEYILKIYLA
jgi:hypothetical protein